VQNIYAYTFNQNKKLFFLRGKTKFHKNHRW